MNGFHEKLAWSAGKVGKSCEETIRSLLVGCVRVEKANTQMDKSGTDYIATLRGGASVNIDMKARVAGASRYWKHGEPEIGLETWSVVPENGRRGATGWTLDESKNTHYTLHTYAPVDSQFAYLLPFQLLRMAYRANIVEWTSFYKPKYQESIDPRMGTWRSLAVFVPASIVIASIRDGMIHRVTPTERASA